MWFARNGYVCLIIDTLQLGEVAGMHHGTYNLGRFWWQAAATRRPASSAGTASAAIDYLCRRPDVDPERIGVTGISGGGATTFWIAAADERVKVAVPVSGMSDLESYVTNKVINGHCDCMFLVNTYHWEWTTIAALIAPRPLLFANCDNDPHLPDGRQPPDHRPAAQVLRRCYGKPELWTTTSAKGGHDYRRPAPRDLRVHQQAPEGRHRPGEGRRLPEDRRARTCASSRRTRTCRRTQINDRVDETVRAEGGGEAAGRRRSSRSGRRGW